ncbi:heat-shock protein Hsp90 [Methanoplanus endosymbiosus]|uniref:Heat-shock protein Hsp90 n=1 Tax=Methanoplanus endosymbiosus TaxID=33865 RepID=A0A9E7TKX9_9EURY|nr:heat-shock protein Hsp90 [Methanoplanus endosymbiosus]UUX91711.1 heat-shock protein Hsp90 [Methanoplanus endosymbiosus]
MKREPNDDILRNFAKAMEDIMSSLPLSENARFLGCTIISGNGRDPFVFRTDDEDGMDNDESIDYELIDGPERIYVTVALPSDTSKMPDVDIQPEFVLIIVDGVEVRVDLPCSVHAGQSYFRAKNGILDIVCEKII